MNILANDGISQEGVEKLTAAGFNTILESVKQENIINFINENKGYHSEIKRIKKAVDLGNKLGFEVHAGHGLTFKSAKILSNYKKIKKIEPDKNCVIGFGITEKTISSLKSADGLVVGSAICKEITKSLKNRQNPVTKVDKMVKKLKSKII